MKHWNDLTHDERTARLGAGLAICLGWLLATTIALAFTAAMVAT